MRDYLLAAAIGFTFVVLVYTASVAAALGWHTGVEVYQAKHEEGE